MRLYDHLRSRTGLVDSTRLSHATVIEATNVYDYLSPSTQRLDAREMLRRCTPPFASTFIEWRQPASFAFDDADDITKRSLDFVGVLVVREEIADSGGWLVTFSEVFGSYVNGMIPMGIPIDRSIRLDVNGDAILASFHAEEQATTDYFDGTDIPPKAIPVSLDNPDEKTRQVALPVLVALFACRFANTANAVLVAHAPNRAERRRSERCATAPVVTYRTIEIGDAIKSGERHQRTASASEADRALHLCRGHFADYTNGPGLFGKYRVEVFVKEHLRGSKKHGMVVSDYRLRPPDPSIRN